MRPKYNPTGNARSAKAVAPVQSLPDASFKAPEPPTSLDDYGGEVWADVWESAGSAYSTKTDHHVIERYCVLRQRQRDLQRQIDGEGFTSTGSQGQVILNPLVRALQDCESKLLPLEDRLGLSPEARIRLGLQVQEGKSKLEAFRDKAG